MSNDKKTIKEMRANDMTPAFPTHPGDVLKDEIEYRGISQRLICNLQKVILLLWLDWLR